MLTPTEFTVDLNLIKESISNINFTDFKTALNAPTGNFFYDPWVIKPEFKNTILEKILDLLPFEKGEARIIILKPGTCYYSHADIDDRWHINLQSDYGYIVDLKNSSMFKIETDGIWYDMDAGDIHSAANFGNKDRIQIVVRHLLKKNNLTNPIKIIIRLKESTPDFRYQFDQVLSPWLNRANKKFILSDFNFLNTEVSFSLEESYLDDLKKITPQIFEIII